jgi:hypothetical protein
MTNRLHLKEALAWTAVILALVLFSVTVSFAQTKTVNVSSEDGKVHIISKVTENGETTVKDTSFELNEADLDKIIDEFTGADDSKRGKKEIHIRHGDKGDKAGKKQNMVIIDTDVDIPEISEADRKKIHEDIQRSMDDMKKGLKEMHKSLEGMKIHIECDDDDNMDFNFNTDFFHEGSGLFNESLLSDNEFDSLRDDDHFIIVGDEDEKAPVLEKTISKNGKQVFVYKRVHPEQKKSSGPQWIDAFEVFPNPSSGIITVKFKSPKSYDLSLTVTDEKGKTVFSEKLSAFTGNYSKEIDLTGKGKGGFLITVSDADNKLSRKIVVN